MKKWKVYSGIGLVNVGTLLVGILLISLTSCSFDATVKKIDDGWEIHSSKPLKFEATEDTFKGDSRSEPLIKIAPETLTKVGL